MGAEGAKKTLTRACVKVVPTAGIMTNLGGAHAVHVHVHELDLRGPVALVGRQREHGAREVGHRLNIGREFLGRPPGKPRALGLDLGDCLIPRFDGHLV